MADLSARESCDTTYHDAQSAAGDGTKQDQHSEPSAAQEGSVASETPYNAEWLSDLIGTALAYLLLWSILTRHLGVTPQKSARRSPVES